MPNISFKGTRNTMKKLVLALTMAATTVPLATPAEADRHHRPHGHHKVYDSHGRYVSPRPMGRHDRAWRGRDGRYYCKRDNGTTGLIIGAGVGALAGHEIAGSGDRTLGTLLGGVAGGLLGREVDRGDLKCR